MKKPIRNFLKNLGPGLITGASDDDPSGIATYSQAGAKFGLAVLWTAWITLPLMFVIQEICARIGFATSKGLITNIKENLHPSLVYFTLLCCIPAIVLNIAADLAAMGAATHLVIPYLPSLFFCFFYAIILLVMIIFAPFKKFSTILKYFCLSLLLYFIVPFLIKQNWHEILYRSFIPQVQFNKEYVSILVAILGTTISPYLFFWQATMEAETNRHETPLKPENSIKKMRIDVGTGMSVSNIVMYFIILTCASVLFKNGITHIETVEQAAKALEPLAGKLSYFLFTIGIVGTGLLAIPVFSCCISYLLTSSFNLKEGLSKKFHEAKIFYVIIGLAIFLGLLIDFLKISPIKALIYTAILYGVSAPPLILIILILANNKKIMGKFINGRWSNFFGIVTFIFMLLAAISLLYLQF